MPAGGTMTIRYTSLCICASHSSRLGSTYLLIVVGWGKMNSGGNFFGMHENFHTFYQFVFLSLCAI